MIEELEALRHEVIDLGTDTDAERIDYPDKARELGEAIQRGDAERGVLICGSGVGATTTTGADGVAVTTTIRVSTGRARHATTAPTATARRARYAVTA